MEKRFDKLLLESVTTLVVGLGTNLRPIYVGNNGGWGFNLRIFLRNLGAGLST